MRSQPFATIMAAIALHTTTATGGALQTVNSTNPARAMAKSPRPRMDVVQIGL